MLLSVLICFYGKKNKRVRVFTLCTLFFSAVSYKKENRQRLYNLLSIFILKLILEFPHYKPFMIMSQYITNENVPDMWYPIFL